MPVTSSGYVKTGHVISGQNEKRREKGARWFHLPKVCRALSERKLPDAVHLFEYEYESIDVETAAGALDCEITRVCHRRIRHLTPHVELVKPHQRGLVHLKSAVVEKGAVARTDGIAGGADEESARDRMLRKVPPADVVSTRGDQSLDSVRIGHSTEGGFAGRRKRYCRELLKKILCYYCTSRTPRVNVYCARRYMREHF